MPQGSTGKPASRPRRRGTAGNRQLNAVSVVRTCVFKKISGLTDKVNILHSGSLGPKKFRCVRHVSTDKSGNGCRQTVVQTYASMRTSRCHHNKPSKQKATRRCVSRTCQCSGRTRERPGCGIRLAVGIRCGFAAQIND